MTPIQIILIAGIVFLTLYLYLRFRTNLADAILIFLFFAGAIFFIVFPDTTTEIANRLGVKRGVNLVFYVTILFLFFLILKLYSRIRRLEKKFTEFVRDRSLGNSTFMGQEEEKA